MELIISTPQGEAEIVLNAVHESVTVGDLLERVLNAKPPGLVYIDGRPTASGTLLSAAGLLIGTVIEVTQPVEQPHPTAATLVQAAGEGGGSRRPLDPGRYSMGTARRANVAPLTINQVLVPRCELVVEHSGRVLVTANQGDLDGRVAASPSAWEQQRLRIGHRVFRVDRSIHDRAGSLTPGVQGQLHFVRPPRDQAPPEPETNGRTRNPGRRLRRNRNEQHTPHEPPVTVTDPARAAFEHELDTMRHTHLDLGEVVRQATQLSEHLWQRRPGDDDAFVFSLGLADQRWTPPDDLDHERHDLALLPIVPVLVDLVNERGVGFACTPSQARAAARALVLQACVAHSPADLDIVVLSSPSGGGRWEWIKWLPHSHGAHGVQLLCDAESITEWVNSQRTLTAVVASIQALGRPITPSRLTLAIVDDPSLWRGRSAMLRGLFAEAQLPVRFVALTDRADDVPAVCTTVVRIAANGAAEVDYPISGPTITDVVPFVLEHDLALAAARKLSPLEDHTSQVFTRAQLPNVVPLASLIDADGIDAGRLLDRWHTRAPNHLRITVGTAEDGPATLDLVDDGPNALIVGSRHAGKTELLRTIVASLVTGHDPATVNVICVEASQDASFSVLAGVPHVVGRVDRFDEYSGSRLLRALRAEVGRRTRVLAEQHLTTIATDGPPVMPHLVVVVDDADDVINRSVTFLPQLLALVDSARHLGLHVVMASERLSRSLDGAVASADIRIALHVNDPAEAIALTGSREPAQITAHTRGRGVLKVGDADAVAVQFASSSAVTGELLEISPFILARDLNAAERKITARRPAQDSTRPPGGLGDIAQAATDAAERWGQRPPLVLCASLPDAVEYTDIAGVTDDGAPIGLCDLPDEHTQRVRVWHPTTDGSVLIVGGTASERSSAIDTMLVAAADAYGVDELHAYVIRCGPGHHSDPAVLESLPGCAAVATNDDPDRIMRVLVRVGAELDARVADTRSRPHVVVFVDDVVGMQRTLEQCGELDQGRDLLERVVGKGSAHGITAVVTCMSEHGVSPRLLPQFQQRIVLHLGDRSAYRAFELDPSRIPGEAPGRAISVPDLVEVQLATLTDLPALVADRSAHSNGMIGPAGVPHTPRLVPVDDLCKAADVTDGLWRLPVGLDTRSLDVALLRVRPPAGALVLGDAGTGKSTVLTNIARCVSSLDRGVDVHAIASTWSSLTLLPHLASATTLAGIDKWAAEFFASSDRDRLVLVDDADRLDGPVFERLAELDDPRLVLIAAGRTRVLELPTHWTAPLRRSRAAILLRPLPRDAAMFGLYLRATSNLPGAGRGLLIDDDTVTPVLLASPADPVEEGSNDAPR